MMNLVEKYTPEAVEVTDEDGVVAIEYVLVAGLVAAGVAIVFATSLFGHVATLHSTACSLICVLGGGHCVLPPTTKGDRHATHTPHEQGRPRSRRHRVRSRRALLDRVDLLDRTVRHLLCQKGRSRECSERRSADACVDSGNGSRRCCAFRHDPRHDQRPTSVAWQGTPRAMPGSTWPPPTPFRSRESQSERRPFESKEECDAAASRAP